MTDRTKNVQYERKIKRICIYTYFYWKGKEEKEGNRTELRKSLPLLEVNWSSAITSPWLLHSSPKVSTLGMVNERDWLMSISKSFNPLVFCF